LFLFLNPYKGLWLTKNLKLAGFLNSLALENDHVVRE
jgi:hypothetical protein